jgi:hypothetical protein
MCLVKANGGLAMKSWFGVLFFGASLLMSPLATASWTQGKILRVLAIENDGWFVDMDPASQTGGATPACAAGAGGGASAFRYVVKASSAGGKAMIASLLAAFHTDKTVYIVGRGEFPGNFPGPGEICNVWNNTETVNYVSVFK